MVPPRNSKLPKAVHIGTHKGRRSPREKRKGKLKSHWEFNSKRTNAAVSDAENHFGEGLKRLCRMLMLLFDIPFASGWASWRTACGLALGGWKVTEGMGAGRGGLRGQAT